MPGDIVFIRNLTFDTILGVLPEERVTPQPVCINIQVHTDTRTAAETESLSHTLDYAALASAVQTLTVARQCLLVETLAESIAALVLEQPLASAVQVEVSKPNALTDAAGVGVTIYRERA